MDRTDPGSRVPDLCGAFVLQDLSPSHGLLHVRRLGSRHLTTIRAPVLCNRPLNWALTPGGSVLATGLLWQLEVGRLCTDPSRAT